MNAQHYHDIDPAVLMAAAGDSDTFRALARTFLDCAPPIFGQLRAALEQCHHAAIGRHSHALRGMTILVGAAELTALLQQLETAARQQQPAPADGLAPCFARVQHEVALSLDDCRYGGHAP